MLCEHSIVMNKNVDPARLQDGRAGFFGEKELPGCIRRSDGWIPK